MFEHTSRRNFLQTTAMGGALAGLGDLGFLSQLQPIAAAESQLDPNVVQLDPSIEPVVKLLEDTPREQLLEKVAERIKGGLTYREVLAALLLAGVRNIQPRPSVGFKFHAVLVVNSAHLASQASPDDQRWLPIFWALDEFKSSQAADVREGNWTMAPAKESLVPPAEKARQAFIDAMDTWDEGAADAAVAGLARSSTMDEVFELFYRYGARDFRDIGHKAIFVANSRRTLDAIGWQHAEPILRSLAYALQHHEGGNPFKGDAAADQPWKRNRELTSRLRDDWTEGKIDPVATTEFLAVLRTANDQEACAKAVDIINRGVSPQSIWDALFVGAGELLMRQPGIVALHAMTSSNALRYAFQSTKHDDTRRMVFLQNVAFVTLFREAMISRGKIADTRLDTLQPAELQAGAEGLNAILADISRNRSVAASKLLTYVNEHPDPKEFIDAARLLIFLKGTNSHDYKFSAAIMEDFQHVSPEWRGRFLAAGVYNLRGSGDAENKLVKRTRDALA
ncbi:MAG TPA: twin-arginine translocation signal domain-containing protein [Schlesneria sp.]